MILYYYSIIGSLYFSILVLLIKTLFQGDNMKRRLNFFEEARTLASEKIDLFARVKKPACELLNTKHKNSNNNNVHKDRQISVILHIQDTSTTPKQKDIWLQNVPLMLNLPVSIDVKNEDPDTFYIIVNHLQRFT